MASSETSVPQEIRVALTARLRERFPQIEAAIIARVCRLLDRKNLEDPAYREGLRRAVVEILEQGLRGIEQADEEPVMPAAAVVQARHAARSGVHLETVLRGCAVADRVFSDFILEQADGFPSEALRLILREQGTLVDRMMCLIASEHTRETEQRRRSPDVRLRETVEQLLEDEARSHASGLDYVFDAWHLGMVARGEKARDAVHVIARRLERKPLSVARGDEVVWGWLAGRRPVEMSEMEQVIEDDALGKVVVAVGEPRWGIHGWRLTHYEAKTAFQVMRPRGRRLTRCREVLLLAAVVRDEKLSESLVQTYLRPIGEDDQGEALRRTLRAYLEIGGNAASTSAALSIDRSTVQRHLRKIENLLGRAIHSCQAELTVALEVDEYLAVPSHPAATQWRVRHARVPQKGAME